MLVALCLLISPMWFILAAINKNKTILIVNFITVAICFIIGIWLAFDLRHKPFAYEKVQMSYKITEAKNILVVEFDKDYRTQYLDKNEIGTYKLHSLKIYTASKMDIFGGKMPCGLVVDNNGKKYSTMNMNNINN